MSWAAASFLLSWLYADKQWGKPAWEQRFICLLGWAARPGGHPWNLPLNLCGSYPGAPQVRGLRPVTEGTDMEYPGPRAGVETASSSFVQPDSGPPPSGTEPCPRYCQPLRPVNARILPGWTTPPPTALIPSHSSVAPFCPIGSFIWLAPLCRLHSPPFSPRALPALSQTFVVLSLVCLTLCPPSLARPHLSHISLDASLPGRLPTARVIIHLLPCLQYGVVVTVTPLWAGDLGRDQ